ncbi:hypothetical protein C922_02453 [Plasmodium inui San Antonio 1]|uniref:Uncharacterized protein n=1 Tax=Plasmodium inui San Antonio 1 TaxID=1237626 RepID=W7A7M9_9APIC|nr:hypothetical protein C922_02453 [Plasmodium inui San Antonio 1]EUD67303.1 hypothetical protein C922_02453 [Plasmodium inui San Antonio 1]
MGQNGNNEALVRQNGKNFNGGGEEEKETLHAKQVLMSRMKNAFALCVNGIKILGRKKNLSSCNQFVCNYRTKRIKEAVFSKHPLGVNKTLPKSENCEFKKRGKEKIKDQKKDRIRDSREEKIKDQGREDISTPHNRTALQGRSSRSFSLCPREAFAHQHISNVDQFNDAPRRGHPSSRNENWERKTYAISQEEKCVASEDLELSLVCPDEPKSNAGMVVYKYCYICETGKPCFCSEENYDYEENIIETIHSNKKKQGGDKINAWVKGQAGFYLQQVKTIKGKLDCCREGRVWNEDTADKGAHEKSKVDKDMDHNGSTMEKRMDALMEIEKKHLQLLVSLFDEYKDLEERML